MTASKIPPVKGGANQVHLGNTTYSIYMKFGVNISIYKINLYINIYLAHLNIVSFIKINVNHWNHIYYPPG